MNFAPGSYLESTSRPLYALLFLLPWIVVYEFGTLWVNTEQYGQTLTRKCVVSFIWLTRLAQWMGLPERLVWLFPGFVVVVILLCWHLVSSQSWRARPKWLAFMAIESVLLAIPLMFLNAALGRSALHSAAAAAVTIAQAGRSWFADVVTSIGAGIYEELIFRFILMGLILMFLEDLCKVKASLAALVAVAISSLLFALHHYIGFEDGRFITFSAVPFTPVGFIFRTAAGVYFAIIFRYRGYGITAGTHAAYNIILKSLWP
ncbi:type II CAAX prenyl endopeptidase Rce1 family protein [Planctomycetota bacterium]